VRFGLRAPDDPRVLDTVRAIDAVLRIELPPGPCWYRYNGDGYGEHRDGRPFDGTGRGRPWPLLTGERAHYALASGDLAEAERLLGTVEALTSRGGLIPEQVWDADTVPERQLVRGQPSGSAMPLVWAHSEHIKLIRSLTEERVFDMPPQTVQRYQHEKVRARCAVWREDLPMAEVPAGRVLRIDLLEPACIRWTDDGWGRFTDSDTTDTGMGLHVLELPTAALSPGAHIDFTWIRLETGSWAGRDFRVVIGEPPARPPATAELAAAAGD
jgi:glucoamylase